MKHRTLRLYCPPNAFVCLFFQRGIGLRDAVTTLSFSSSSAAETLTSLTEACPVLLFAKTGEKMALIPHAAHSLCLFLVIPLRNGDGNEDVRKCAYLMKTKKKQQRFRVRCMPHSYIFLFWCVFVWRFSFDVPYETTFILEWRPRCCRYRLCVRSLVSNFLPESSSLKCKLAASENVFLF